MKKMADRPREWCYVKTGTGAELLLSRKVLGCCNDEKYEQQFFYGQFNREFQDFATSLGGGGRYPDYTKQTYEHAAETSRQKSGGSFVSCVMNPADPAETYFACLTP